MKIKKPIIFMLALLFFAEFSVFASDTVEIDIAQAVEMACKNSDDLKISEESLDKLNNMYREVRASVFPQISGSVSINRFLEAPAMDIDMGMMGPLSVPMASDWENSISLQMSQVLWTFGKVVNAIHLAENYINLEKHSEKIKRNELTFAVKKLYYSMLMARNMVKIASESYENALKNKDALSGRYSGGRISNLNNIKMEADISGRVPRLLQAKQSYEVVEVAMKDMLGVSEGAVINLSEGFVTDFPEYRYEELKGSLEKKAPVLMVYRDKLKLAETQIKLKKSGFFPTISGFLNYSYSGGSDKIIPDEINREVIAGVMLNYDIWTSGKRLNALKQSENDKNIAELELKKMKRALNVELRSAITEYNALKKTYEANKEAVKLASKSYDIMLSNYNSGAVSQTALNDAELQLTGAKMQALQTLYSINVAIAKIEKLIAEGME